MTFTFPKITVLCFLCGSLAFSQSKKDLGKITELLEKSFKVYENSTVFRLSTEYKLYPTFESKTVGEKYGGFVIKNKQEYYSKIDNTEFVQLRDISIKIDNQSKLMQLNKINDNADIKSVYNLKGLLNNFNDFKLLTQGDYYVCSMTSPQVTFIPYGKIVIFINKKNYTIAKEVFYLLKQAEYNDAKGNKKSDLPRLEIALSPLETKNIAMDSKFDLNHYITVKNKKSQPSKFYASYKIVD